MNKKTLILIGFIILKFVLQYVLISPEYDLQRDEYLHLDQAHHLAWGYLSVPPVTSWFSYLILLLGNSVFWVKFFPALFGVLTLIIIWKTIELLKGNLYALVLGAMCIVFSSLLRINMLYQPNSFDVLCWTAFYYILIQYIISEKPKWLYIGAVVFAFGFLNKYNILFLLIGLLPALILSKQRKILAEKKLYFALFLGLILILPNLLWQYNNQFPIVHHMKELSETQLVNVNRADFLKEQLLFFIGSFFVILASFYALLFYKPFEKFKFLFASIIFTIIVFLYFKAKAYYAIGLYPIYIALGSVFLADILNSGWKRYLKPVFIALPLLFFVPMYYLAFPNRSPEKLVAKKQTHRWEDGKEHNLSQDFADMLGWKELARKTDSVYALFPKSENTLVLCDNYGQAGAINFYTKKGIKAVSFNADYVNWFNLNVYYKNLIRVKTFEENSNEFKETSPFFQSAFIAGKITNKYAREYGTTVFVFTNAKVNINKRLQQEIDEEKNYIKE
ncbi:glycosyltransferase family 39 protein [Flavobacterium johnsoniae]|uniref:Glycosyl transferase, family 39 n=1 Tax=Flavobacterium johnsoniae (strain ATCC 17061 / DSM 2064 / JCM 8514 / BCRC 14874 / CCUG 350202 / NBRC 14942 / NCIMB 11054 / UW101) TaxID=376686 RepID=A5FIR4_FLAJ1|nr:glycosyltransferase family 39 protein [Flavobacterium johnsoniae]ABQ04903.1 glycosyl transferase, family 39 [Flavobacterium johnsoniae UW101]OXG02899.1 glycosyl transferase [Flavobacterium johnsoniae UW101]WQG83299.1 glycosyltransferase family 39 protein [Flavobacterium johnsoniae UW101]SHK38343.1 Dolichyl-phosphate-mannose-protein mannosyltransferase [Flavobacterium johnsoniae]